MYGYVRAAHGKAAWAQLQNCFAAGHVRASATLLHTSILPAAKANRRSQRTHSDIKCGADSEFQYVLSTPGAVSWSGSAYESSGFCMAPHIFLPKRPVHGYESGPLARTYYNSTRLKNHEWALARSPQPWLEKPDDNACENRELLLQKSTLP